MAILCYVLKKDLILKMLYNHTDILFDNIKTKLILGTVLIANQPNTCNIVKPEHDIARNMGVYALSRVAFVYNPLA